MAVPVAALNFVPTTPADAIADSGQPVTRHAPIAAAAQSVAVATERAVEAPAEVAEPVERDRRGDVGAIVRNAVRAADFGAHAAAEAAHAAHEADDLIGARAVGVTPQYAAQMRGAAPQMARVDAGELSGLRVHNVTPEYVRELHRLGFRGVNVDEVMTAAVQGVSIAYARSIAAAGYSGISVEQLAEMKMFGVTPAFIERIHRDYGRISADDMVQARITGLPPR